MSKEKINYDYIVDADSFLRIKKKNDDKVASIQIHLQACINYHSKVRAMRIASGMFDVRLNDMFKKFNNQNPDHVIDNYIHDHGTWGVHWQMGRPNYDTMKIKRHNPDLVGYDISSKRISVQDEILESVEKSLNKISHSFVTVKDPLTPTLEEARTGCKVILKNLL